MSPPRAKAKRPSDDEYSKLKARLAEHLADVRAQFQESIASYSVKVQGRLSEIDDVLTANAADDLSESDRQARLSSLKAALRRVDALKLKPGKGRRRDLRAVQQLGDEVMATLSDW